MRIDELRPRTLRLFRRLLCVSVAALTFAQPKFARAQGIDSKISSKPAEDEAGVVHSISGNVLDPSGAAIAKAQVTLLGSKGEILARAVADDVGSFA